MLDGLRRLALEHILRLGAGSRRRVGAMVPDVVRRDIYAAGGVVAAH